MSEAFSLGKPKIEYLDVTPRSYLTPAFPYVSSLTISYYGERLNFFTSYKEK